MRSFQCIAGLVLTQWQGPETVDPWPHNYESPFPEFEVHTINTLIESLMNSADGGKMTKSPLGEDIPEAKKIKESDANYRL